MCYIDIVICCDNNLSAVSPLETATKELWKNPKALFSCRFKDEMAQSVSFSRFFQRKMTIAVASEPKKFLGLKQKIGRSAR